MRSHCDSCVCDDKSSVSSINARIRKAFKTGKVSIDKPIVGLVFRRLVNSDIFRFGFRDYLPAQESMTLIGCLLCGLKDPARNYGLLLGKVGGVFKPFQYSPGDRFDLSLVQPFHREDFQAFIDVSEKDLVAWLNAAVNTLYDFVEQEEIKFTLNELSSGT